MPETLDAWVDYLQTLHARDIDLTLERVNIVYRRLRPSGVGFKIITVAGTNGKGSTCEILASIYHQAGYQTGKFTSPHILRFNERFSLNRAVVSDAKLQEVLSRIEIARESISLTFFEFGTLAAIELFADQGVDVAIMEVGLGGRLDAVNILEADVTVITSISIDHTDWLGNTVEKIALEKVGVTRASKPCVISIYEPPSAMIDYCLLNKVPVSQLGADFKYEKGNDDWRWSDNDSAINSLPMPFKQSGTQLQNASAAITVVRLMQESMPLSDAEIKKGLANANLQARCQIVSKDPLIIVDVAHNQASIASLLEFVKGLKISGEIHAICGMLKDKQIEQSLAPLAAIIDQWHLVSIQSNRGADARSIQTILGALSNNLLSFCFDDVESAYNHALGKLNKGDTLIVFGSFFIVGDIMPILLSNQS